MSCNHCQVHYVNVAVALTAMSVYIVPTHAFRRDDEVSACLTDTKLMEKGRWLITTQQILLQSESAAHKSSNGADYFCSREAVILPSNSM